MKTITATELLSDVQVRLNEYNTQAEKKFYERQVHCPPRFLNTMQAHSMMRSSRIESVLQYLGCSVGIHIIKTSFRPVPKAAKLPLTIISALGKSLEDAFPEPKIKGLTSEHAVRMGQSHQRRMRRIRTVISLLQSEYGV